MSTNRREQAGATLIGVGGFLVFLGALFFLLVWFGMLPNESWMFPWITTLRAAVGGAVVGITLLGAGLYTRSTLAKYTQKVSELEEIKEAQEDKLKAKSISLGKARAKVERKEIALKLTRGKLKKARVKAEKKEETMLRVRGKLGDRSRRLKRIRKLTKVGQE